MRAIAIGLILLLAAGGAVQARDDADLYRAKILVTGQGEENRDSAFIQCFGDVLIKVSGDSRIAENPRFDAIVRNAAALVTDFSYRDRMAGIPVHDEQGTRDRPYELTVSFDPARIDAALLALGERPWSLPRPRVVMFVGIVNGASARLLTADGGRGRSMRDAIGATAWQLGLPLSLPEESLLRAEALDIEELSAVELPALNAIARSAGGDVALLGSLVWDETAGGWKADWRLDQNGIDYRWQVAGVSFDQAFRNAAAGAAMILSAAE